MKKFILIAAVAVMGMSVNAQETRFGVKGGYAMSTLKVKDNSGSDSTDPLHSFYIGGLVEHKLNDNFGLQGEILYSQLGGKVSYAAADPNNINTFLNVMAKQTFQTVQVPVSAKYFITEGLSVSAGASFGFILSAKQESTADFGLGIPGISISGNDKTDIKDQINTLNIAPFLGAEYMLENGFFFDARYNVGVSNLDKNPENGSKTTNSFLQVGVGFKFGGN